MTLFIPGKGTIKWTQLSCRTFAANAVRLQLHAFAYNLGNFVHAPQPAMWSADKEREPVPIAGDAERPVPDARGDVSGASEG
jgi:hypothetical protein